MSQIDWDHILDPVILQGNRQMAYRDPAGFYHEGVFRWKWPGRQS